MKISHPKPVYQRLELLKIFNIDLILHNFVAANHFITGQSKIKWLQIKVGLQYAL